MMIGQLQFELFQADRGSEDECQQDIGNQSDSLLEMKHFDSISQQDSFLKEQRDQW